METPGPILRIENLVVRYATNEVVKDLSFDVARGEVAAIVGESGSGKSQAMLAALGLLAPEAHVQGKVLFGGEDLLALPETALNAIRGKKIAIVFQDPMSSLDPYVPVGRQIGAILRRHAGLSATAVKTRTPDLIDLVGLNEPEARARAYPHELSGGQRQRIAIAMAVACNPDILIADEPTTALDVTVEARIIALLSELKARLGMAMIFISHDLALVRHFADSVHVMRAGERVESGPAAEVSMHPRHTYTKTLLAAAPPPRRINVKPDAPVLLQADDLCVRFDLRSGLFAPKRQIAAVDHVSLTLRQGQTLGLVGESGSGKSTLGRALLKLIPASGRISFEDRDLTALKEASLRPLRQSLQLIFQDPSGSLSPRQRVADIVTEGLRVQKPHLGHKERAALAQQALHEVGLDAELLSRFPHELSGGQRQRVAIARVLILKPKLIVLDEPTSALDRSVQSDILALLTKLQADYSLTYVFISHDLSVVRSMADSIAVMKDGRLVEFAEANSLFTQPKESYTKALIAASLLKVPQSTEE